MKELERIYQKRKKQLLPLIFGFAAFFVLFRIILPQWADIQQVQDLLSVKTDTVRIKENNLLLLNSIPTETIDENYNLITTALPVQKDIVLIFNGLESAARKAGVTLGGFTVNVGGVYSSGGKSDSREKTVDGLPYLNILVNIVGEGDGLRLFAEALYESVPLTEINTIDISKRDASYDVNFYYKPIVGLPSNSKVAELSSLTQSEVQELDKIREWASSSL